MNFVFADRVEEVFATALRDGKAPVELAAAEEEPTEDVDFEIEEVTIEED
jgi:hypothetical protein